MSNHYKDSTNPFVLFFMLLFIGYLVYWVFTSQYAEGKYIAKAHPHVQIGADKEVEEKKPNKFKIEKITAESKAYGKELYDTTCKSCHGATGLGDGAAGQGIKPVPRNFTKLENFKFGYSSAEMYTTLEKGSPGTSMAAFGYLPEDDRIAITHYVRSLMPVTEEAASTGAVAEATDSKSNSASAATASVEADFLDVVLEEKGVSLAIMQAASKQDASNSLISHKMTKTEKLKELFDNANQNVRVASSSRLFVDQTEKKLNEKLVSYSSFKEFVLSENVYNLIGESFVTLNESELQSLYQQINGK